MLFEVSTGHPPQGSEYRRWFCDESFDLFVWQQGDDFTAFQLCYDKRRAESAINYRHEDGFAHYAVEDGDLDAMWHDALPILMRVDRPLHPQVIDEFLADSAAIDGHVREYVATKLREYGEQRYALGAMILSTFDGFRVEA